jgi:hypothetical protein
MDAELRRIVCEMRDRHEIYDCLVRYCRGIDRFDRDIVASAYHPGAVDDHGDFVGPAEKFIDHAFALHARLQRRTQHHLTNHICEIQGDTAHTETYYIFRSLNIEAPWHSIVSGRYIDRLERRSGKWGIVARICTVDVRDLGWDPTGNLVDGHHAAVSRDTHDPSYLRPLTIDLARYTVGS